MNEGNLFQDLDDIVSGEWLDVLAGGDRGASVRVERILSKGQASEPGFWYDQEETEWVVLLRGAALLRFEAGDVVKAMIPGDWVEIPVGCRHRVELASAEAVERYGRETVWLAVFWA